MTRLGARLRAAARRFGRGGEQGGRLGPARGQQSGAAHEAGVSLPLEREVDRFAR